MNRDQQQQSVTCVIFSHDRSKVLLIKRRDVPVWVLPGGGIDPHETPAQAMIRETNEETGYRVNIVRKIAEYTPLNRLAQFTHLFECSIISGTPNLTTETQGIEFFFLHQLPKIPPPYGDWIADGLTHSPVLIKKSITSVTYGNLFKCLLCHPILVSRFLLARLGFPINDK